MRQPAWILTFLLLALPAAAKEQPVALLTHATGEVMVRHGADWVQVDAVPVDLFTDDKVATEQGRAEIYFWRDGSTLVLDVGTNLTLSEEEVGAARKIFRRIQIFLGDVWFELRRSFNLETELETPTAVGGLRGTEGLVRVLGEGESEFTLVAGELEIAHRAAPPGSLEAQKRMTLRARQVLRALQGHVLHRQAAGALPRRLPLNIPVEQLPKLRERWRELIREGERPPAFTQLRPISSQPNFIQRELLRRELRRQLEDRERRRQQGERQREGTRRPRSQEPQRPRPEAKPEPRETPRPQPKPAPPPPRPRPPE